MGANKGILVTVRRIDPETEYEGTVFDQTVIVGLPDGSEMGLFDKDVLLSDEMVGEERRILVSTLTNESGIKRTAEGKRGVQPNPKNPLSWDNHAYCGQVNQIIGETDRKYKILLDVGDGKVIVRPKKEQFPDLEVGDVFQVTAIRSDVYDVENIV